MNTARRGALSEKIAVKFLEQLGQRIMFKSVRVRFQSIDFDNHFDIVSIDPNDKTWIFSQIKTNCGNIKKEIGRLREWKKNNLPKDSKNKVWLLNYRTKGKKKGLILEYRSELNPTS